MKRYKDTSLKTNRPSLRRSASRFVAHEILKAKRLGKIRSRADKKLCEIVLISFGDEVALEKNKVVIDSIDIQEGWENFLIVTKTIKQNKGHKDIYRNFPGRDKVRGQVICAAGLPPHSCMRTIITNKKELLEREDIAEIIINERIQIK